MNWQAFSTATRQSFPCAEEDDRRGDLQLLEIGLAERPGQGFERGHRPNQPGARQAGFVFGDLSDRFLGKPVRILLAVGTDLHPLFQEPLVNHQVGEPGQILRIRPIMVQVVVDVQWAAGRLQEENQLLHPLPRLERPRPLHDLAKLVTGHPSPPTRATDQDRGEL